MVKSNNMKKASYLILISLFFSCAKTMGPDVEWYYTKDGGPRLKNPADFEYNTEELRRADKSLIDTSAIYVIDSLYDPYDETVKEKKLDGGRFCRFFSNGQVLFVSYDSILTMDVINNPEIGTPGYFVIEDNKLKTDIFQNLNGGQTGKYFGLIKINGDLVFFEQRPETYDESYKGLEDFGKKTVWKKTMLNGIDHYKPNW
jgi:hypothetical protein